MVVNNLSDSMYEDNIRVLSFEPTDEDNGGELDPTGLKFVFTMSSQDASGNYSTNPFLVKDSDNGPSEIEVTASTGPGDPTTVKVTLNPEDTEGRGSPSGTPYYFQLETLDVSGNGVMLATGTETISANVDNEV